MKFSQILRAAALFGGLLCSFFAGAQTPGAGATNAPDAERFLFIVETSATMAKRSENLQKVVASIVANGLHGQIGPRSTIGIWTFNEQLFTGKLPVQTWTPDTRQILALTFAQFLQKQPYEKSPRLSAVWEAVTNVVAKSEHITLLLVTSGHNPVVGTPYDAIIAESFKANLETQRERDMPFLTILRAARGQFVAYSVTTPPWPLEVPEYPAGLKPVVALPPPSQPIIPTAAPPLVIKHENLIVTGTPEPAPAPARVVPEVVSNVVAGSVAPTNVVVATNHSTPAPVAAEPTVKTAPPTKARVSLWSLLGLLLVGVGAFLVLLLVLAMLLRIARRARR